VFYLDIVLALKCWERLPSRQEDGCLALARSAASGPSKKYFLLWKRREGSTGGGLGKEETQCLAKLIALHSY